MNHLLYQTPEEPNALPVVGGKYQLVRQLGAGGMGAVWVARNEATGAEVALKVLLQSEQSEGGADLVQRLRREAYATARLSHRGIVRIFDLVELGEPGEQLAIVMELLHGRTLADHLKERGKLSVEEAVAIALPMLSALSHAHTHGVVHRDLKPENVFLAVDPDAIITPKILDFGISKVRVPQSPVITQQGEMLGTPSYMSPEQVRGLTDVDGRSDLFNVGILLYEMISGRNPFVGDGLHPILVSILEEQPKRLPDVPAPVWRVIERALRKAPEDRFATAGDLASALRSAMGISEHPSYPPRKARYTGVFSAPPVSGGMSLPALAPNKRSRWGFLATAIGTGVAAAVAAAFALYSPAAAAPLPSRAVSSFAHSQLVETPVVVNVAAPQAGSLGDRLEASTSDDDSVSAARDAVSATIAIPARAVGAAAPAASASTHAPVRSRFVARDPGF